MPRRRDRGGAEDDSEQHLEERVLNEKCVRGRRKGGLRHHDCGDETGVEETAKTERHQVQGPAAHRRDEQKKCFACGKRGHVQAECPDLRGRHSAKHKGKAERGQKIKKGDSHAAVLDGAASSSGDCSFPFVDPSCSLHGCFMKAQHYGTTAAFFESCGLHPSCEGIVAMFADEACMSQSSDRYRCWEGILTEENTWGSFGCLPGEAHGLEQTIESRLEDWVAAAGSKVVALVGGLDYRPVDGCGACDEDNRTAQKRVLSLILSMAARLSLPLALSCAGGAESDLRTALDDSGLPADAALHLFEFSGDADFLVLRLMRAWPNLYVGFDGRLTHAKAEHLRGLLFDVPMERLLIQSSAPNHIPASLPGQRYCHPGMLPEIAVKVAQLKEMELGEVMEQARANVKAVYGI